MKNKHHKTLLSWVLARLFHTLPLKRQQEYFSASHGPRETASGLPCWTVLRELAPASHLQPKCPWWTRAWSLGLSLFLSVFAGHDIQLMVLDTICTQTIPKFALLPRPFSHTPDTHPSRTASGTEHLYTLAPGASPTAAPLSLPHLT